ncbi:MAG: DUF4926 domain-containing protein [Cyanobacteria bacterium P01_C01_bin.73]
MINTANQFQLLDVVALKTDLPAHHLNAGQVGTLVEQLAPGVYEVEFSDDNGQTYAMLPLPTGQLLKLYHAPNILPTSFSAMENTIHQYGNGDNIAGDKIGNQISGSNIGSVVNEARDNTQVTATHFAQTTGINTAELLQLIDRLRQTATQLPAAAQEDLIIDIEDVEAEVKKPEEKRSIPRLQKRLTALLTAATLLSGSVAAANTFVDEVVELGEKAGIELQLPPSP